MTRSDFDLLIAILFGGALFTIFLVAGVANVYRRPEACSEDITEKYTMPPELAGCRVHRLLPKGHGRVLYVVSKDDEPAATVWDDSGGKNSQQVEVLAP